MAKRVTNDGRRGGKLVGPTDEGNGKGIPAVVSSTGQPIILGGEEVIINKEAAKKHWKTLDKINQSTGGAPIAKPVGAKADAGGKITASPEFQAGDIIRAVWGAFPMIIKLNFRLIRSAGDRLEVFNLLTKETKTIDKSEATLYMRAGVAASPSPAPDAASRKAAVEAKKDAKIERRYEKQKAKAEPPAAAQKAPKGDSKTTTEINTLNALSLFVRNNLKDVTRMDAAQTIEETVNKFILDVEKVDGNKTINLTALANLNFKTLVPNGEAN